MMRPQIYTWWTWKHTHFEDNTRKETMPLSLYNVFVPLTKRALRASGRDWCFIVLQFRALSTSVNTWYTQSTWFPGASVSGIPIIELRKKESDLEDSSVLDEHHTPSPRFKTRHPMTIYPEHKWLLRVSHDTKLSTPHEFGSELTQHI